MIPERFPIKDRLKRLVRKHPGLTACAYTRLMKHPRYRYATASVLKQLHREVARGKLVREKCPGMRGTVVAWRFFPVGRAI
jgi:hypothetical protein